MVSKASDDLPEPESPVMTTRASRGMETVMSLRLCSRAPETTMESWRGIHNQCMSPADERAPARPRLADDAESGAARARHVARGVAGADHQAIAAGLEPAVPEAPGEAGRARARGARLGEAALERDPAPAARAGAVAGRAGEPLAADAAQGPVLLDREGDPRGLAERVGDGRAGADRDAGAAPRRPEAPGVKPRAGDEGGRRRVRGGRAEHRLAP